MINEQYFEWLKNNPKGWAETTVKKYESAVRAVSKDMIDKGTISKPLYEMTKVELDAAIFLILQDEDFLLKDAVGNKMYSNGIKQYRTYIASSDYSSV